MPPAPTRVTAARRDGADSAADATRARLLAAALDLFTSRGYAATTTREIVEAAGVTKPVLYYHFGNKEGLYRQLVETTLAAFPGIVAGVRQAAGTPRERILRLADDLFELFLANRAAARLMYAIHYGPPQGAPHYDFEHLQIEVTDVFQGLVEEGIRLGQFRRVPARSAALVLWAVLDGAMELNLSRSCPDAPDHARMQELLGLALAGIEAPRPAASSAARSKGRAR